MLTNESQLNNFSHRSTKLTFEVLSRQFPAAKTFLKALFNNKNKENLDQQLIHLFLFDLKNARRNANEA